MSKKRSSDVLQSLEVVSPGVVTFSRIDVKWKWSPRGTVKQPCERVLIGGVETTGCTPVWSEVEWTVVHTHVRVMI